MWDIDRLRRLKKNSSDGWFFPAPVFPMLTMFRICVSLYFEKRVSNRLEINNKNCKYERKLRRQELTIWNFRRTVKTYEPKKQNLWTRVKQAWFAKKKDNSCKWSPLKKKIKISVWLWSVCAKFWKECNYENNLIWKCIIHLTSCGPHMLWMT